MRGFDLPRSPLEALFGEEYEVQANNWRSDKKFSQGLFEAAAMTDITFHINIAQALKTVERDSLSIIVTGEFHTPYFQQAFKNKFNTYFLSESYIHYDKNPSFVTSFIERCNQLNTAPNKIKQKPSMICIGDDHAQDIITEVDLPSNDELSDICHIYVGLEFFKPGIISDIKEEFQKVKQRLKYVDWRYADGSVSGDQSLKTTQRIISYVQRLPIKTTFFGYDPRNI